MEDTNRSNRELSTTTKSSTGLGGPTNFSKTSLFNRSMTIHATANPFNNKKSYADHRNVSSTTTTTTDRNVSTKKWFNKVRQLKTLFETPKTTTKETTKDCISNCSTTDDVADSGGVLHDHHVFARLRPSKSYSTDFKDTWSILDGSNVRFPGTEDRVVVYFTSLRGVRRTFEDCFAVKMIFRGFRVFVDERDVSMDNAYKKELLDLLGEKHVTLPQVFIKGRLVGGVDVVRQLNETGELRKILQALPVRDRRFVCDTCGDVRFVPCSNCSGSRKVFDEDEGVAKRCVECNENGLLRCPECCC